MKLFPDRVVDRWVGDLPHPPSLNQLYGYDRKAGYRYLKPKQRTYRQAVAAMLPKRRTSANERYAVYLHFYDGPKRRGRRPDLDNLVKAVFDAMEAAGTIHNDGQVRRIWIEGHPSEDDARNWPRGRVRVSLHVTAREA